MIEFLLQQFQLDEQDLYHVDGPVNLYRLREVLTEIDRPDLKYPAFTPSVPAALEAGDDDQFETHRATGRPAAPSVPVVRAGARLHPLERATTRAWSRSSRRCTAPAPTRS